MVAFRRRISPARGRTNSNRAHTTQRIPAGVVHFDQNPPEKALILTLLPFLAKDCSLRRRENGAAGDPTSIPKPQTRQLCEAHGWPSPEQPFRAPRSLPRFRRRFFLKPDC